MVLLAAAFLDYLLADPLNWPHPVQGMGWVIARYTDYCFQRSFSDRELRGLGILLALLLVVGSGALSWGLLWLVQQGGGLLAKQGLEIVMLASCFAARSLRRAAEAVLVPLQQGDLGAARVQLSGYVGRDTAQLSAAEILRAVLETVSENATDGVLAPLFYALLGELLGVGWVPLAMAYKAASTLDSMVGYRRSPYTYFGWCSARLEDGLTWVPCRLTVLTVALWSGRPWEVLKVCQRDAIADPSPNAGWSECAYAAALGVQLGGANFYEGQVVLKPKLGEPQRPITVSIVEAALQLTRLSFLSWLGLGLLLSWLL